MGETGRHHTDDIDLLLRNAELRTELEPYYDDSISRVNIHRLPLAAENEYLASMLAWEMAPVLPIYRWFEPELRLPRPEVLSDDEVREILDDVIQKLFEKRIVLEFTDHLSDRELYRLIYRDILPSREKKLDLGNNYLHWDCAFANGDPEVWLRYYASEEERQAWATMYKQPLPPREEPPYRRNLPKAPL
ncbi:hypothetical protein JCM19992_07080 [Thermostilla marina]